MKRQAWRGSGIGVIASLSLIGFAGVVGAQSEPAFPGLEPKSGEAVDTVVTQLEPVFPIPETESGEAVASSGTQSEPFFDFERGTAEAVATTPPQSGTQSGVQTYQLQDKR
jgi:hypothetical protein